MDGEEMAIEARDEAARLLGQSEGGIVGVERHGKRPIELIPTDGVFDGQIGNVGVLGGDDVARIGVENGVRNQGRGAPGVQQGLGHHQVAAGRGVNPIRQQALGQRRVLGMGRLQGLH